VNTTSYTAELGDVLMSLQAVLLREARADATTAEVAPAPPRSAPHAVAPVRLAGVRPSVATRGHAGYVPLRLRARFKLVGLAVRFDDGIDGRHRETILAVVAEAAHTVLREDDRVYRTGDAEIAILIRETDDAGASAAAVRVESAARALLAQRGIAAPRIRRVVVEPAVVLGARQEAVPA
jgi:Diguanylate cyclase, GGDEF domain